MYTMAYDIRIGGYRVGMLESVEINSSVELLADTAVITLPGAQYNETLDVENKIRRGDAVSIRFGYAETGLEDEFTGYVQRIGTDGGTIKIECEDALFKLRVSIPDTQYENITLQQLLLRVLSAAGGGYALDCAYSWTYDKFVVSTATAYDILKKVQEECGADIYLRGNVLHVRPPGDTTGEQQYYDFALNVESDSLEYRTAQDRKVQVVVKAAMPDGTVKELEVGTTGGDKVEVIAPATDEESMRRRGESELKRRSFDGYDGKITTWLVPHARASDSAFLHDADYPYKDGNYFVSAVKTTFSSSGGKREVELGFKLS